jgi:hypothetical protein
MARFLYQISSTVIAPPTSGLTTLATVKTDWNITGTTDDTFINNLIARCSLSISQYLNRTLGLGTYLDTFRPDKQSNSVFIDCGNCAPLRLRNWPLVSIDSIIEGTVTLAENTDFEADYATGLVHRLDKSGNPRDWGFDIISVTYHAGYVLPGDSSGTRSLPLDIEDAASRMVYMRYVERGRDPMIAEDTMFGLGTIKYFNRAENGNMPPDVIDILNNYRLPVFG